MTITITQTIASNEDLFTFSSTNDEAVLRMAVAGLAQAGASASFARLAVQDADFAGFRIVVRGANFSYDGAGHLTGGRIDSLDLVNATGSVVGTLRQPGGLAFDVAGYIAVNNNQSAMPGYFGTTGIVFNASAVPAPPFSFLHGAHFTGGFGQDQITGSAHIDALSGGHGSDTIRGGAGADVLYGDNLTITLPGFDETGNDLIYGGIGDDAIYGNAGNDRLFGDEGNDRLVGDLIGETGNDALYGGVGNDQLWGGMGDDTLNGGAGYDRVAPHLNQSGAFTYAINLTTGIMTGQGTDVLISVEGATGGFMQSNVLTGNTLSNGLIGGFLADTITGGGGNDRLQGLQGADVLAGSAGDDLIAGGEGMDTLGGGTGADRFVFAEMGAAHADQINDFLHGTDRIILQFGPSIGANGALSAAAFKRIDGGSVDADDRVLVNRATGEIFIDLDGSGAQTAILVGRVQPGTVLTETDFQVLAPWDTLNFA